MARMFKYIFSALLLLVVLSGNSQTINGRLYTQFNNYYKWRGGAFDSVLLLPNVTATAGLRGGALRYNGADSSLYVWSGFQWRKIDGGGGSTPTLQQVTTQGSTTTNEIRKTDGFGRDLVVLRASGADGQIRVINPLEEGGTNNFTAYERHGIRYMGVVNTGAQILYPDTSVMSQRFVIAAKLNGVLKLPSIGGVIDLGTITSTPDSSIFATRFWVNSTFQPIGDYLTTGSSGSLQSLTITGTNGNGHIHLRHQASLPTATGQSTVIYANSNGDFAYKNDGNYHTTFVTSANTADRSYTFKNRDYTVADDAEAMKYIDTVSLSNRINAITPGVQWTGVDSAFALNSVTKGYHESEEFMASNSYASGVAMSNSYFANNALNAGLPALYTEPGIVGGLSLSTGTNAAGGVYTIHISYDVSLSDTKYSVISYKIKLDSLDNGTQKLFVLIGLVGQVNTKSPTSGVFFGYIPNGTSTGSSSSANWQCATINASTRTWTTTSTPVVAGSWINLKIITTTTRAHFYVNGALVAIHTTNIPTSTTYQLPIFYIVKEGGTIARRLLIDNYSMDQQY